MKIQVDLPKARIKLEQYFSIFFFMHSDSARNMRKRKHGNTFNPGRQTLFKKR